MVTLTEEQRQILEDAEDLYHNAPCGYTSFSPNGTIIMINRTLLRWLGYEAGEVVNKMRFTDFITIGGKMFYENQHHPLLKMQGYVDEINYEMIRKDKSTFPVLVNSLVNYGSGNTIKSIRITVTDITDRKKYELELLHAKRRAESEKKRFMVMAEMLPEIVWTASHKGTIDFVNYRLTDYSGIRKFVSKEDFQTLIHPGDFPEVVAKWKRSLVLKYNFEQEFRIRDNEGNYYWFLARALPFFDDTTGDLKWIGVCMNTHNRRETLRKMDEFLSIASHELKTPLTTIKAYIQLLDEPNNALVMKQYLGRTKKQVEKLEGLISELLDVSKIQAGQMQLVFSEIPLVDFFTETVESLRSINDSHAIRLALHIKDMNIKGDRHRLEQVLINVIGNAIKYSPQARQVDVEVKQLKKHIEVSVKDYGIGISKDHLDKLFDRFYRVTNTSISGLGIGLYICSEIIRRHGGRIWVESEIEKGSTFYFTLPL